MNPQLRNQQPRFTLRVLSTAGLTLSCLNAVAEERTSSTHSPLEEVVVTSERLGRSTMETATSVSVLDGGELERRGLAGSRDVLSQVPNVTASGTGGNAPAIRGIDGTGPVQGADSFLAGTRSRLNVQIDGRAASHNEILFGDAGSWDVQQVEMLRGSQSTLQGRNAMAGTLAVRTNDPTYEWQARARVAAGNFDSEQYAGAISGPLIDNQVAFRLSGSYGSYDSFLSMAPYAGVSDPGYFESTLLRGKLLIEPSALAGFKTLITLSHSDYRGPQGEYAYRPFDGDNSSIAAVSVWQPRATSAVVETTWDLGDSFTFHNLLTASETRARRFAPTGAGNGITEGDEYVAEPMLKFHLLEGRLQGLAGIYVFRSDRDEHLDLFGGGTFEDSTDTNAVFTELTFGLTDTFDVTLGGRYEEERHERYGRAGPFAIALDDKTRVFLPKLVGSWHPREDLTLGALISRGYNGGGAGFTYAAPFVSYEFKPEYVLNYEAFVRKSLLNDRLKISGNLFFSDYEDIQLPFYLSAQSTVIRNADEAITYGAEFSATWQVQAAWSVFGELGVLKTDIRKYPGNIAEGKELARAPAFTGGIGTSYTHPSGIGLTLNARYSDAYYSDVRNEPRARTDAYWLANGQVSYVWRSFKLFAYGNNLFDERTALQITSVGATPLLDQGPVTRPRTYGVGVQVDF